MSILISLFLIANIVNILLHKRHENLCCGLWGFCGSSAPDPDKIRILSLFNLKRGEHATGFFADGTIRKAAESASTFLAKNYKEFESLREIKNFVVIGHDRQASVGSKDKVDQAHPHGIKDNNKYSFILAHNGTISNTYYFAQHYKQDFTNGAESDSQLLAKVMANVSEERWLEPLKHYDGTATVVFHSTKYRHTVFIHRDPQREIFYYQEAPDRLYWSSIRESLFAIGGDSDTVSEFKNYEVCKISKGKIVKTWSTSDREPLVYKAPNKVVQRSNNNWSAYDDMPKKASEAPKGNGFTFANHRYFYNGHKYTGIMYIKGSTNEFSKAKIEGFDKFYFVEGLMAINEKAYDELINMGSISKVYSAKTFNSCHILRMCEYTRYPILAGIEVTKGTLILPGKYHRTNYGDPKDDSMTFCPELSSCVYKITKNGTLIETKILENVAKPKEVTERSKGEFDDIREALLECLTYGIEDFSDLYTAVKYAMNQRDTIAFYDDVVTTFLDICEQTGAVEADYTSDLRNVTHFDQNNHEDLNTLLKLYYSRDDESVFSLEEQLSEIQKNNLWWSNHNSFRDDIANAVYDDLDDFFITYCETDEEDKTKEIMMGVAIELNRLGVLSTQEVIGLQHYKANDMQRSLSRYYEIYVVNKRQEDESQNCCVADPTDVVANLYLKVNDLRSIPSDKITAKESNELNTLKQQIKNLILAHKDKINEIKLKIKYELELPIIQAINE